MPLHSSGSFCWGLKINFDLPLTTERSGCLMCPLLHCIHIIIIVNGMGGESVFFVVIIKAFFSLGGSYPASAPTHHSRIAILAD